MNRSDLIRAVFEKIEFVSFQDVEETIDIILETIIEKLLAGYTVEFRGIGTFSLRTQKRKQVRNPKSGEVFECHDFRTLHFKPSPFLKQRINA